MVALSTLILAPMSQLGCATACSGVTEDKSSTVRSGPPLAVSVIQRTSSIRPPSRHWKIALCSLSTGRRVAPCFATAAVITSPAETSASLLASAMVPPSSIAAMTGPRPAQPTIAATVISTGLAAASQSARLPPAASIPEPSSAARSSTRQLSSATTAISARNSFAKAASSETLQLAVSATTRQPFASRRIRSSVEVPTEPVAPRMEIERLMKAPASKSRPRWRQEECRQFGRTRRHGPE